MSRRIFGTIMANNPREVHGEVYTEVPFGSRLEGLSFQAGVPVVMWSIADCDDFEMKPKETREFYIAKLGDILPDDMGDFVGWFVVPDVETREPLTFNVFVKEVAPS